MAVLIGNAILLHLVAACLAVLQSCVVPPLKKSDGFGSVDAGAAGASSEDSGAASLCEVRCAAASSADCPGDSSCAQDCEAELDFAPWCREVAEAWVRCVGEQLRSAWSCDSEGRSVLLGLCRGEQEALDACLKHGPLAGMPNLDDECAASCSGMQPLSCAPAGCFQVCHDTIEEGPCSGAAGLVALCGADLTAEDYDCTTGAPVPTGNKCGRELSVMTSCLASR